MKGRVRKTAKHDKAGRESTKEIVRGEEEIERKMKDAGMVRKRNVRMKGITQQKGDTRRSDESVNGNRLKHSFVAT